MDQDFSTRKVIKGGMNDLTIIPAWQGGDQSDVKVTGGDILDYVNDAITGNCSAGAGVVQYDADGEFFYTGDVIIEERIVEGVAGATVWDIGSGTVNIDGVRFAGKTIVLSGSGTAQNVNIFQDGADSTTMPVGTIINFIQTGTATTITFAAINGAVLNASGGKNKLSGRYSAASVIKVAANSWVLVGDIKA